MNEIALFLSIIVMFVIRIGLPVLTLIALGILFDRWQSQRQHWVNIHYSI